MLKTKASVTQICQEVTKFLSNYINVEKLILFGSYADNKNKKHSDFDIAIISTDIAKMGILEKIELFSKASLLIDSRIELKGFDKKEFLNPGKGSMLEMIKKEGKIIYSRK